MICTYRIYTGVRTKGYSIPYKVQPPTQPHKPRNSKVYIVK